MLARHSAFRAQVVIDLREFEWCELRVRWDLDDDIQLGRRIVDDREADTIVVNARRNLEVAGMSDPRSA